MPPALAWDYVSLKRLMRRLLATTLTLEIAMTGARDHGIEPAKSERFHHLQGAALHEHDVTGLDRNAGSSSHGDAEIGLGERGRIIDAVAHKSHTGTLRLQLAHLRGFLMRGHLHERRFDAEFMRERYAATSLSPMITAVRRPWLCKWPMAARRLDIVGVAPMRVSSGRRQK